MTGLAQWRTLFFNKQLDGVDGFSYLGGGCISDEMPSRIQIGPIIFAKLRHL